MNNQKKKDLHSEKTSCGVALLCHYEARYDELVERGKNILVGMKEKSFDYDELRRMVNRLEKYKDSYIICCSCVIMKPHLQTTKQNVIYVIVKLGRKYQDVSAVGREFSTIVR